MATVHGRCSHGGKRWDEKQGLKKQGNVLFRGADIEEAEDAFKIRHLVF